MLQAPLPTLRWGIIATGAISSAFVTDLILPRPDAKAQHTITAIGSSSQSKGDAFVSSHLPTLTPAPKVYPNYASVYTDPNVDIVYIATPHAFHKQNCLDAIRAGKHILCEKAFTLNARDARAVFAAAKTQRVFVMEAMWTRFFPLVHKLQHLLHSENIIGAVYRVFADFSQDHKLDEKGMESRLKNRALGAGSLLNLGVYSATWALLALDREVGRGAEKPIVSARQMLRDGIDVASTIALQYASDGRMGMCTSSSLFKNPVHEFCRIEGSEGHVVVEGSYASRPEAFTVYKKNGDAKGERYEFEIAGGGLFWEADAVAHDIAAGKLENEIMPWEETVRVLELMDEVRKQGGAKFEMDEWD
ncbi:NAD(P)-binding protein [Ophiobolus disseminans]|uniref:D-xylose 1-dehydrogenase (NADP(+), D-xylono-1,5-lactone-forming) n=1 Tax=Ophiobolus disseminans TaxID=1469910 RepID=A0A6A6ZQ16_9PLEO|nr:NAD(P)-binding protein [Ophiobolus disseminans]